MTTLGKLCISTVVFLVSGMVSRASEPTATAADISATARCEQLASIDFSGIRDAPTQILDVKVVQMEAGQPSYCQVHGYVWPQVGFELRLPLSNWNGKLLEAGCGGSCGSFFWAILCPMQRSYACIASDMGHTGKSQDLSWADNNLQAQIDYDIRGTHVTALAGKAITARYYSKASEKAYFMGCSTGGRQALAEAQRFPWDFDGIIGLDGSPSFTAINLEYVWGERALRGKDGRSLLGHKELQLVHNAALAHCDMDDGVKDGIISDPYHCDFDPSELLCKAGKKAECLTQAQVDAVKKVYAGPMTSKGEKKSYLRGSAPGSEMGWVDYQGLEYVQSGTPLGGLEEWSLEVFRYMAFTPTAGAGWQLADLDFDRDYKRLGVLAALVDVTNPDLRAFKQAGGKLIYAYGLNDQNSDPAAMMDYYENAERVMGGRPPTQEFFRLFMVPGMDHCTGGDGAFAIDYLTYLENWVERGQPPDKLIGAHVDSRYLEKHSVFEGKESGEWMGALMLIPKLPLDPAIPVTFTRPIYPYPTRAKYKGSGDANDAASFGPVEP
jgi:hypothetical protein